MVKINFFASTNDRLDENRPMGPQSLWFDRFGVTTVTIERLRKCLPLFKRFEVLATIIS